MRISERYLEPCDFGSLLGKPFVFGIARTVCVLPELDAYIPTIRSKLYRDCAGEPSIPVPARESGAVRKRLGFLRNSKSL